MGTPLAGIKHFGHGINHFGGNVRNWRATESGTDAVETPRRYGAGASGLDNIFMGGRNGRKVSLVVEEDDGGVTVRGGRGDVEAHQGSGDGEDDRDLVCPASRLRSPHSEFSRSSNFGGGSPGCTRLGGSPRYNERYLGTPTHGGAEGDRRFLNRSIDERMAMSGASLSYAGDGCAEKWGEPISVSDRMLEAMSNAKDRQHDELQAILEVLDEVRFLGCWTLAEPARCSLTHSLTLLTHCSISLFFSLSVPFS